MTNLPHDTQDQRLHNIIALLRDQHSAGLFNMLYWKREVLGPEDKLMGYEGDQPDCGTIACIGGTCELAYPHLVRRREREANVGFILGMHNEVARRLCYPPERSKDNSQAVPWTWINVETAILALLYAVELTRTTFTEDHQCDLMWDYWHHLYEQHQGCPPSL